MDMNMNKANECKRNTSNYHRTKMQKELVILKLKEEGLRVTKQRLMLLDIILNKECSSCKEIYYIASRIDPDIGVATVYRMINTLERIGAISSKNIYRIDCDTRKETLYTIELDDHTVHEISADNWNRVILEGLKACGYINKQKIRSMTVQSN